jgi:hypothetical protein
VGDDAAGNRRLVFDRRRRAQHRYGNREVAIPGDPGGGATASASTPSAPPPSPGLAGLAVSGGRHRRVFGERRHVAVVGRRLL